MFGRTNRANRDRRMPLVFAPLPAKINALVVQTRVHINRWYYCVDRILRCHDLLCSRLTLIIFNISPPSIGNTLHKKGSQFSIHLPLILKPFHWNFALRARPTKFR